MVVKRAWIYVSFCCIFQLRGFALADPLTLIEAEQHIRLFFDKAGSSKNDADKKVLADSISLWMGQALSLAGSFDYPFGNLDKMGKIRSKDGNIRLYTWNMPWTDGTNTYFGFLQYKAGKSEIRLSLLHDSSLLISNPEEIILTPSQWYGMLVYEIVEKEFNDRIYYTLLGYDNENPLLSRKIIDVLYFSDIHEPLFGKAIFHYQGKVKCRIIFEYSARVQMSLKWNDKMKMIIFDHLSPSKPSFTGNYQFYGPDFSYDGLRFDNGIWVLVEDVDVRNLNER
jgi:hypothetical protein